MADQLSTVELLDKIVQFFQKVDQRLEGISKDFPFKPAPTTTTEDSTASCLHLHLQTLSTAAIAEEILSRFEERKRVVFDLAKICDLPKVAPKRKADKVLELESKTKRARASTKVCMEFVNSHKTAIRDTVNKETSHDELVRTLEEEFVIKIMKGNDMVSLCIYVYVCYY
jgi:hypothetical protein